MLGVLKMLLVWNVSLCKTAGVQKGGSAMCLWPKWHARSLLGINLLQPWWCYAKAKYVSRLQGIRCWC